MAFSRKLNESEQSHATIDGLIFLLVDQEHFIDWLRVSILLISFSVTFVHRKQVFII